MKKTYLLLWGFLISVSATGCFGHLVYSSGPYRGQVLDAETKEPLVGAVVLAIWYWEAPGLGGHGPAVDYHDALEALTDAQGEFTVPAKTLLTVIGKIREPKLVIYYPGYGFFPSLQAYPQDDKEVRAAYERRFFQVKLIKLKTREERMKVRDDPVWISDVPDAKMPNLVRLVNKERQMLGLQPIRLGR